MEMFLLFIFFGQAISIAMCPEGGELIYIYTLYT